MICGVYYDGTRLRWANRRLQTANVVFGEVLYEPGGVCGPRVQRDFELVILHSGQCEASLDKALRTLAPGAVYLFLPGGHEHFHFSSDQETHHSVLLDPAGLHTAGFAATPPARPVLGAVLGGVSAAAGRRLQTARPAPRGRQHAPRAVRASAFLPNTSVPAAALIPKRAATRQ